MDWTLPVFPFSRSAVSGNRPRKGTHQRSVRRHRQDKGAHFAKSGSQSAILSQRLGAGSRTLGNLLRHAFRDRIHRSGKARPDRLSQISLKADRQWLNEPANGSLRCPAERPWHPAYRWSSRAADATPGQPSRAKAETGRREGSQMRNGLLPGHQRLGTRTAFSSPWHATSRSTPRRARRPRRRHAKGRSRTGPGKRRPSRPSEPRALPCAAAAMHHQADAAASISQARPGATSGAGQTALGRSASPQRAASGA
jgi:hypothetical protein